jgi:diacylglycerol kinase
VNHPPQEGQQSFIHSLRNAGRGLCLLIAGERNFRIHLLVATSVCICAGGLGFSLLKWIVLLISITLVLLAEALNSAIETVVDLVEPEKHPLAGQAKDIAAAAVLIASIISVIIGVLLFGPPLLALIDQLVN